MEIEIKEMQCRRCNHKWIPRKTEVRMCPKCRTVWFDKEKNELVENRKN